LDIDWVGAGCVAWIFVGVDFGVGWLKERWLREGSKRDSSTSRTDSFTGVKLKKKRRPASVGMTGFELAGCGEWQDQMNSRFLTRLEKAAGSE